MGLSCITSQESVRRYDFRAFVSGVLDGLPYHHLRERVVYVGEIPCHDELHSSDSGNSNMECIFGAFWRYTATFQYVMSQTLGFWSRGKDGKRDNRIQPLACKFRIAFPCFPDDQSGYVRQQFLRQHWPEVPCGLLATGDYEVTARTPNVVAHYACLDVDLSLHTGRISLAVRFIKEPAYAPSRQRSVFRSVFLLHRGGRAGWNPGISSKLRKDRRIMQVRIEMLRAACKFSVAGLD